MTHTQTRAEIGSGYREGEEGLEGRQRVANGVNEFDSLGWRGRCGAEEG